MQADKLQQHVFSTYIYLRVGMAVLAAAFPLILWIGGAIKGMELQHSMSDYYHPDASGYSMRDWFVGILFAVGAFLCLYKGYSRKEDWALNLAGVFAVGTALCPVPQSSELMRQLASVHSVFAILFFLCIAYVCLFCAGDTLPLLQDARRERKFRAVYRLAGGLMIAAPLTASVISHLLRQYQSYVYFAEVAGIWAFAGYWIAKSFELAASKAELLAVRGHYPVP